MPAATEGGSFSFFARARPSVTCDLITRADIEGVSRAWRDTAPASFSV
jgi:hypothetical protein